MGERVLVVGTGLIGGSVGLALRERGAAHVTAFDADARAARRAVEVGAADAHADDLAAAAGDASVVVVATPVTQVTGVVASLAAHVGDATVVTDVGSTKAPIVGAAERALDGRAAFVGGHPMAGSEGEGVDAARADMFVEALWILTPTEATDAEAFRRVHGVVSWTGARVLALAPDEHDRLVALVSHLPYALATCLMALAGAESDERVFRAAAGSFRDVTRTAGSSPGVWRDILSTNRDGILRELDAFTSVLGDFRAALESRDWEAVDGLIAAAGAARRRLPLKGDRAPGEPVALEIVIPDRSGMLAEITTAVGGIGVNIEDLRIQHTGAGGVVLLVVDGAAAADAVAATLRERGLHATVVGTP